jgi:hypothetical protein
MANFLLNSTGRMAVRKDKIVLLRIEQATTASAGGIITPGDFILFVRTSSEERFDIPFEHGSTVEAVQALAAPIIAALEE